MKKPLRILYTVCIMIILLGAILDLLAGNRGWIPYMNLAAALLAIILDIFLFAKT